MGIDLMELPRTKKNNKYVVVIQDSGADPAFGKRGCTLLKKLKTKKKEKQNK